MQIGTQPKQRRNSDESAQTDTSSPHLCCTVSWPVSRCLAVTVMYVCDMRAYVSCVSVCVCACVCVWLRVCVCVSQGDVPDALNHVLDTLPTRLDVTGLPFSTSFEYSIFTLTYVMVKGEILQLTQSTCNVDIHTHKHSHTLWSRVGIVAHRVQDPSTHIHAHIPYGGG